jgi:xanthine dehydrogenase accessory factor
MVMDWLAAIRAAVVDATPAVLVTVASVEGSAPREPGAKMVVTGTTQTGTIGGGHMEMRACEIAREMLTMAASLPAALRRIERFALGPSLGQCCGGVVHLAFERIVPSDFAHYAWLHEAVRQRQDCWRLVPFDSELSPILLNDSGQCISGTMPVSLAGLDRKRSCHLMKDDNGTHWLIDPCFASRCNLFLFGAGHVGTAIVQVLADVHCNVTWVDEREAIFPENPPANVTLEVTDIPETIVSDAPAGSACLVLTHSHALDLRLAEAILRRNDIGWFGLIGSHTKRMRFEHRLREHGIAQERLNKMVCPIGIPGITSKAPSVIAISVCAQLLKTWEAAAQMPALREFSIEVDPTCP